MSPKKIEFFPPVIAHRGAPLLAPENTLHSFMSARKSGALWIEADVKLSADGIPMLMHDDTLERTTNGQGKVADMSWADMQTLDAGSWFSPEFSGAKVTSLTELLAFSCAAGMRLVLELKPSPGRTQATVMVALIEASKLWPDSLPPPLISSFDTDALMIAAQLHPDWPRSLLLNEWRGDWAELAVLTQASVISLKDELLTAERLSLLEKSPLPILAHTVNDPVRAKILMNSGIRAVYSDDAATLLKS